MMGKKICTASFRDPSGFLFRDAGGVLYRQINPSYAATYRRLMDSGLYEALVRDGLLIAHEEVPLAHRSTEDAAFVIRPRVLPFISYPYEWCFTQLQEAALLTLSIQKRALDFGLSLKDCSAFNVQFEGAAPVFIDTLSFEPYREGPPWIAYGQFCRHFLAPLALMATADVRLGKLLGIHLDGIPLDLAARLIPWRTHLRPGLLLHLHLHARAQRRQVAREKSGPHTAGAATSTRGMTSTALRGLIDSLETAVRKLSCPKTETIWGNYYETNTYTAALQEQKQRLVAEWLDRLHPASVWDLGANTGVYSRVASSRAAHVLALDFDWACVEANFRACREGRIANVLPLWMDLANPSPGLGWAHTERDSLADRGPAGVVLALALVHHLAIGNNVPLPRLAAFLRTLSPQLIVEFVPKDDPQTQRLLEAREDIFAGYNPAGFESAFQTEFRILERRPLEGSQRVMYLMQS